MKIPLTCKHRGGKSLTWDFISKNKSGVQEGRLRSNEVESQFFLGCDECLETLMVVSSAKIVEHMNNQINK